MNTGKYVFAQVADFIPRYEFDCIVKKYNGDYHVRDLTCYNLFLHMMFGQLTVCNSIRDICLCLKAHQRILYPLGFRQTVNVSSLSRANRDRDYRIWEELGYVLIDIVRPLYRMEPIPDVFLPGWEIFAIDSTTISCSIKLMTWALGKYERGAVKMHTMLSLRGSIPTFIHITHGKWHDSNFLDVYEPYKWAIYTMDKAYVDFEALFRINEHNAYWITRAKNNMKYEVIDTNYNIDESTGLRGDDTIRLTGPKPKKLYPKPIRMVKYYDAENDEDLTFITNQTDISALQVADLYRNRWQIETFFKWDKGQPDNQSSLGPFGECREDTTVDGHLHLPDSGAYKGLRQGLPLHNHRGRYTSQRISAHENGPCRPPHEPGQQPTRSKSKCQ